MLKHQEKVWSAYERLGSAKLVAEALGLKQHTVRARLSEARKEKVSTSAEKVSIPAAVYTGRIGQYTTPLYTGHGRYTVDRAIVVGDVHVPCTDWDFAEKMVAVAQARKIKTLFVVGDFWDFNILSRYDHLAPPAPLGVEIEMGSRMMMRWRQVFNKIVVRLGNHDVRLQKMVAGGLTGELWDLFLDAQAGVEFLPYGHVEIMSGGQLWRATHQAAYSRIKLRTADELAQKHQANIITWHEHHVGKSRDRWNRYTLINGGGLFDSRKFAYVNLFDTTLPVMNQGFVVLENGFADVLTPYATYTDWSRWI